MPPQAEGGHRQVVVVTGHLTDAPDRAEPRFPETAVAGVAERCAAVLERWGVGPGTLVLTGGARGADIAVAELALRRGAEVRLLLAAPPEQFEAASVRSSGTDWVARFRALAARCPTTVLDRDHDGTTVPDAHFAAVNDELLAQAAREAGGLDHVDVLAVWDGRGAEGTGGTAELVSAARRAGARVEVVRPLEA